MIQRFGMALFFAYGIFEMWKALNYMSHPFFYISFGIAFLYGVLIPIKLHSKI